MTTAAQPASVLAIEQRVSGLERGVRLFAVTLVLLSSVPNLALAFSIEAHAGALAALKTILPEMSTPALSAYVMAHSTYFILLAILWPLAGMIITLRAKEPFRAMVGACVYLLAVSIRSAITWIAFVAPLRVMFMKAS
jgi:hypothetical protein